MLDKSRKSRLKASIRKTIKKTINFELLKQWPLVKICQMGEVGAKYGGEESARAKEHGS